MDNKFRFEDLNVYQEALRFVDSIYSLTSKWPKDEIFGLTNQFRRASVSIALNIAEGTSRTKRNFRHFLDLSKGSCFECAAILSIPRSRKYINQEDFDSHYDWVNKLARMISKLKTSLRITNNE
ncbi:MAG: hypothetical protein A2958_02635 [Candidatus Levybacteria bacterium RIFCSPLOWO2_01_FULL_38_13]|nr:MAG: hypothetical protein A2629_03055 [Candidatus Levybacteria bacterium RIFCSPHIGHO2_01_FULL_41_15]OGH35234.1 MAG: hypothetical protein A2958_02635 [Candidatus Levybacteria bacterium RIFCSPLOWO2_01_FULL_38_13]